MYALFNREYGTFHGIFSTKKNAIKILKTEWENEDNGEFYTFEEWRELFFRITEITIDKVINL